MLRRDWLKGVVAAIGLCFGGLTASANGNGIADGLTFIGTGPILSAEFAKLRPVEIRRCQIIVTEGVLLLPESVRLVSHCYFVGPIDRLAFLSFAGTEGTELVVRRIEYCTFTTDYRESIDPSHPGFSFIDG